MKKAACFLVLLVLMAAVAGCSGSGQGGGSKGVSGTQAVKKEAASEQAEDADKSESSEQAEDADKSESSEQVEDAGRSEASVQAEDADKSEASEQTEDEDKAYTTFTMYFVDPESSPYVEGGRKIAELVQDATDGKIRIDVIGGSEAGERELVEQAMDQKLDIVTCANSVLTNYIPQMNILDQAYLWENEDQAHAAVDGKLGEMIRERAERLGLHVIGFEESGFRNTFTMIPVEQVEDFSKITIRTMENKYHKAAFEAFGADPIATPDGRFDGQPLAEAISPRQGFDKNGPTAYLTSAAKLPQVDLMNGTQTNIRFTPSAVRGDEGTKKLYELFSTFFDEGGMQVQFNVVGTETLYDAQEHPEDHQDLIVRIAGYSAYFVEIPKVLQDDFITRTEHGV